MPNTTARGYGYEHQRLRAALLPQAYGHHCPHWGIDPECTGPMLPGQPLDLDHTDDRTNYRGMAHAPCNRRAGARKGNAARRAHAPDPEDPCTTRPW
jgi:hypothetical protein